MTTPLIFSPHFGESNPPVTEIKCGLKACELAKLPNEWTPPYFVIPVGLQNDMPTEEMIFSALNRLNASNNEVIVRSSATAESIHDRGMYHSHRCANTPKAVLEKTRDILSHFNEQKTHETSHEMAIIVQIYIEPVRFGHLSNERRVSKEAKSWHIEHQQSEAHPPQTSAFTVKRNGHTNTPPLLSCHQPSALQQCLRDVAVAHTFHHLRYHFEWAWNGKRLWIVQSDIERPHKGTMPGLYWLGRPSPQTCTSLKTLTPALQSQDQWRKSDAIRVFNKCGLPTGEVFILDDREIIHNLANGNIPHEVRSDLELLLEFPILIRTDLTKDISPDGFLLPRTDAIISVDEAVAFLTTTAKNLTEKVSSEQICFLLHRFIAARACAYSYAKPGLDRVRVDATWGGPDSLLCYPHDTYEINRTTHSVSRKVRCKTHYLDMNDRGIWSEVSTGTPWDWKQVLHESEINEIADYTCRIANHINSDVEVMFFIGARTNHSESTCLPWFFSVNPISSIKMATNARYAGRRAILRNNADINITRDAWKENKLKRPFKLSLRPDPNLLRSESFLQQVAKLAIEANAPVELEGSILSHCYYILQRDGVKVTVINNFDTIPESMYFGKLVRDKIPDRIESHGEYPLTIKVTADRLLQLLRAKAVEEALELFWEENPDKFVEELADLLEVIHNACRLCNISFDELAELALKKRASRGGFEEGFVLLETHAMPLVPQRVRDGELFIDDDIQSHPISPAARKSKLTSLTDRQPTVEGNSILIPLIPPDGAHLGSEQPTVLNIGNWTVVVSYSSMHVRLEIGGISGETTSEGEIKQLQLPFTTDI